MEKGIEQKLKSNLRKMLVMTARIGTPRILVAAIGATLAVTLVLYLDSVTPKKDDHSGNVNQDRIVFSGIINSTTHQIFIVNPDGTGLKNLTSADDDSWHFDPVPSPDGSKVAYETWDNFPNAPRGSRIIQNLYVVKTDGTDRIRLTPSEGIVMSSKFSWSPDSTKIAYESSEDIYLVNADGTNALRLTSDRKPYPEGMRTDNYNPFWLSNNNIIFASVTFNGTKSLTGGFREISADGTGLKTLFVDPDYQDRGGYVWSNDGESIAILQLHDFNLAGLYVMNASGKNERLLVDSSRFYSISDLSWSPDDSMISFVGIERLGPEEAPPSGGIYVVKVNDGTFRRLPGTQTLSTAPVWSSDATKIAFMSTIGEEAIVINVIDVNSNEKNEVTRIKQSIVNQPLNWISGP